MFKKGDKRPKTIPSAAPFFSTAVIGKGVRLGLHPLKLAKQPQPLLSDHQIIRGFSNGKFVKNCENRLENKPLLYFRRFLGPYGNFPNVQEKIESQIIPLRKFAIFRIYYPLSPLSVRFQ